MRHKSRTIGIALALSAAALLTACGGGGSSPTPTGPASPSGLSYPAAPTLVKGQAITPLSPTVTGNVTSYTVAPALPAGLTVNEGTGVISGTPTAVAATSGYTVTARNSGGSTTAVVSITVNDVAPAIDYGSDTFRFTSDVAVNPVTPVSSGGTPVTWTILPALPPGLALGATDGRITGTPTAVADPQTYLVTASNSGGQSQASLTISVESGVLLELGHANRISRLRLTATRALSQDISGHWVLWNLATAEMLAQGDSACTESSCVSGHLPVELAGATVVVQTNTGLETRAAADGHVLATIAGTFSSWKLASDGTYVVAASATSLRAWSTSGAVLFTRSGNYSQASAFAAANEVRVARGAAGDNVIEQILVANGASSVSASFLGGFHSWFLDGERFFTNTGTTVRVYSKAVVQQDLTVLPSLGQLTGQGSWFWIIPVSDVSVYAVGASTTPAATYSYGTSTSALASGTQLAVLDYGIGRLRIVDLSTAVLSSAEYVVPHGYLSSFGANASGQWLIGNCCGVLLDGTTLSGTVKYFGYGAALSIAGSETRVAIATAARGILYFDALTRELEGTLDFDSSHVELSSDGSVLAASANTSYAQYRTDRSLKFYALPSGTLTGTRPYTYGTGPVLGAMSLSRSGEFVAESLYDSTFTTLTRRVTPVGGGAPIFSDSGSAGALAPQTLLLSPNGHRVSITTNGTYVTNIYEDGSLIGAAPGRAIGWLDDERLLLNQYDSSQVIFTQATINAASGAQLAISPTTEYRSIQVLTPDSFYSAQQNAVQLNAVFSVTTGAVISAASRPATNNLGAVAGSIVVYLAGSQVRAEQL